MEAFLKKSDDKKSVVWCEAKRPTRQQAEQAVHTLLLWIGEKPEREGLLKTPTRVAKAYGELFRGYSQSAEEILGTVFEEVFGYNEPVLVRDIPFFHIANIIWYRSSAGRM